MSDLGGLSKLKSLQKNYLVVYPLPLPLISQHFRQDSSLTEF